MSLPYRSIVAEARRDITEFQVFMAEVLTVDYERKVCTLRDLRNGVAYQQVSLFPSNQSSHEGTDVNMPEQGSRCCAAHVSTQSGFFDVVILSWTVSDTNRAQQGIAMRAIDTKDLTGWNKRLRGSYRKAYPGQKTVTNSHGYSERLDDGWDRLSADFSRDRLDPDQRTWSKVTSREVHYNDSGVVYKGPVVRPGAAGLTPETMPDGTTRQTAYLAPGAVASDRYVLGQQDVIALVEKTEKIQEFALDFPVPIEAVGNALLDTVLGTTANLWGRTTVQTTAGISYDSQSFMITQAADSPVQSSGSYVGPTTAEGPTPCRRGYIIERSQGTLVGSNIFDPSTYGQVLKPVVFPYTTLGKFSANTESGYLPVVASTDHAETRVAASAYSVRFPHEGNTTRWDITKEGMLIFEIGSSLPGENIDLAGDYEYPHGAGRSIEGNLVGSMKMVIGKNRDEEEALDLQALGQSVIRLGADDTGLPNLGRTVMTQIRGSSDAVQNRSLQYWTSPTLSVGDAVSLTAKVGAENVSLRGSFDGGTILRLGAKSPLSLRRHIMNGYVDGPGVQQWAIGDSSRQDSRTNGRPTYGAGDSIYAFHDLTQAGKSQLNMLPYAWSGSPVTNMDQHGLSLDLHAVRDCLFRIGKNEASGQSLLLDLAGGIAAAIGKDSYGRSVTASLDGGVELVIGPNTAQKGLRLEITGDVDWVIKGHFNLACTGDMTIESSSYQVLSKTDIITKAQNQTHVALNQITHESPNMQNNQGFYASTPFTSSAASA
jgi:hypothetical protein